MRALLVVVASYAALAAPALGHAQSTAASAAPFSDRPVAVTTQDRLGALEAQVAELELKLAQAQQPPVRPKTPITFKGYVDFGFFVPGGNAGAGILQDFGNRYFPQYKGQYGWVFLGDLLGPAVNSRGEAADLGNLPGVARFDSVHSRGAAGFLVNEANVSMSAGLGESALLTTSLNLVPRTGSDFSLGDVIDLDIAQLVWMPTSDKRTALFIGKTDSVLGIEYRERKADRRFGITPSLIARYTTGTALGVKVRSKFFQDDRLIVALAVTNGTNTWEQFHFYNEVDTNSGKTVSGRVAVKLPVPGELEVGVSGMVGPQDRALDNRHLIWFLGADALYRWRDVTLKAEYLRGKSPGDAGQGIYALSLRHGGYLEYDWMILPWLGMILRAELRDAFVTLGSERAYLTKSWRATVGARLVFSDEITLKAEYLHNGEYGGVPQISNDVFTSSLVFGY